MISKDIENKIVKFLNQSADVVDLNILNSWLEDEENQQIFCKMSKTPPKMSWSFLSWRFPSATTAPTSTQLKQRFQEPHVLVRFVRAIPKGLRTPFGP